MSLRPMTPAEIKAAQEKLAALEQTARKKLDAAIETSKALETAQYRFFQSTRALENEHGSDWWKHTDTQERIQLKEEIARLSTAARSADRAWKIAEGKAYRAGRFKVVRTYTDKTGWVENLAAFFTDEPEAKT